MPRALRAVRLHFGDLRLEGSSRAGSETWFRVFPPGLALDVGRGALPLSGARDLFISHGHLDHALGVPYVLSQRTLHRLADTRVLCPVEIAGDIEALIEAAASLERVRYRYEIVGLTPGQRVQVGRDLFLEVFGTDHVVPSLGCHLLRRKRRLAQELRGRPQRDLVDLRRRGELATEEVEERLLSYCGDTGPGVFEQAPEIFQARVLLLECTFLDGEMRDRGRRFKHLHLVDLIPQADRFANEAIVLHHLSRRHRLDELRREVDEHLPAVSRRIYLLSDHDLEEGMVSAQPDGGSPP